MQQSNAPSMALLVQENGCLRQWSRKAVLATKFQAPLESGLAYKSWSKKL